MEVTDVNHLMSLLQPGSVSFICDSAELQESSNNIVNTALTSQETDSNGSLLHQSLSGSLVITEDDERERTHDSDISCVLEDEMESDVFTEVNETVKVKRLLKYHSDDKSSLSPQLPEKEYFIQMNDGRIMQVLGTLEQDEVDSVAEIPMKEISSHEESTDDVQVLVVGSNIGEDVYLINTPDKVTEGRQFRDLIGNEIKDNTTIENTEEASILQPENGTIMSAISTSELDDAIDLNEDDSNCQDLQDTIDDEDIKFHYKLEDSTLVKGTKLKSRSYSSQGTNELNTTTEDTHLDNKDVKLSDFQDDKNHLKAFKEKHHLSKKLSDDCLKEGSLVRTDRGDMIAYNLSSLSQPKDSTKPKSKLHVIASMFGPAMKVLRPIEPKIEAPTNFTSKEFSVFSCKDCDAVLHSERSLQNHQRKHHKDLEEECFVCGMKFLNMKYVRKHIQEKHSNENSFHCRLCSYKCDSVKDFHKHQKCHNESNFSCNCGKKFQRIKFYRSHMMRCGERKKSDGNASELSPVPCEVPQKEYHQNPSINEENFCNDGNVESDQSSNSFSRRKSTKNFLDQTFVKNDTEFKFESKHYNKQAKKMAIEQPVQRSMRAGRQRSHRCYLCFKLFPTEAALESHKENYHLTKSERPVRVKTDSALDEREEFEGTNTLQDDIVLSESSSKEVEIKEEPLEFSDDFENVTIIVDDSLTSPHIIKPLCIACKSHTSIDFRKYSKWLNQIPHDCQSDILKKFHHFFPTSFDLDSLEEPWMLCKKCVVLIDKIADMEEKLSSLKSDLLFRVKGNCETSDERTSLPHVTTETTETKPETKKKDNFEDIGKNLSYVEAYMKNTCEIMEITKPQKRPGRPKKHASMIEKLTPVLVEDNINEELESDIVRFATPNLVHKELENTVIDLILTNDSDPKNDTVKVKQECVEDKENSGDIECESVSWKTISLTQDNKFGDLCAKVERSDHIASPSREMIFEVTNGTGPRNEIKNIQSFAFTESKSRSFSENFTSEVLMNQKSKDLHGLDDAHDMLEKANSRTEYKYDRVEDGLESHNSVISDSNDDQCDRLPSTIHSNEEEIGEQYDRLSSTIHSIGKQTDEVCESLSINSKSNKQTPYQKLDISSNRTKGRKRSRVQEEKNKMCYKIEELDLKPWRCTECHKPFSTKRGACDHYTASHKGQNYACQHCSVSYVRKRDLIGHYNKMHLNVKPYKCKSKECSEMFSSHGDLYRHLQSAHPSQEKYDCHVCGAEFREKRYRDAHLSVCLSKRSDSMTHKCPLCSKTFKLSRYLEIHMRTVHWVKDQQFLCEICNKILTDKKNVILHMKSHLGETKVKCEVCGKEFNRKAYLWTHMRTHTNQRPYKCNYCTKAFNQYSTWKNHERTHTGEKPYKCQICSAHFSTSSSLSKHVQYGHFNIKDYECDICKKKFISKAKVEEHIKIHTGEKPFKCHICNRAFNKKTNLKNHMYVHSANKKYKCEICGEGFMRKSTIENHVLECHKFEFVINSNGEGKDVDVEVSPSQLVSQFISMKGADDVPPEDSYIIVFANDDEEQSDPKEMQLTVLAEDRISSQSAVTTEASIIPSNSTEVISSVHASSDVLSGVISDTHHLTTLIRDDIPPSITIPDESVTTDNQVMEIDDPSFRLVEADAAVQMYSKC